jgi:ring-1,2-phenylacetyl-CoA epoxidase subunit PaaE
MAALADTGARHAVHALRVAALEALTDDAIAITFAVPGDLRDAFAFTAGQHVAVVRDQDGEDVRRSYSICSPIGGALRVGVKRLPGGRFSSYAHEHLRVGDTLDVLPPSGRFTLNPDPSRDRHYAGIAAGSGITPIISILATALAQEPGSHCTLLYGNRTAASIMFLEDIEDLKNRYPTRLEVFHVLSGEPRDAPLLEGRLDAARLELFLELILRPEDVDEWFLCGPLGMVEDARRTLRASGVARSAVHRELFHVDSMAPATIAAHAPSTPPNGARVTIVLDGRTSELTMAPGASSILDAVLPMRADAPYACKGGVCGTCRCRLVEGAVRMDHDYALEDDEIEAGVRLACQSHPVSERVVLDFDAV